MTYDRDLEPNEPEDVDAFDRSDELFEAKRDDATIEDEIVKILKEELYQEMMYGEIAISTDSIKDAAYKISLLIKKK